MITSEGLEYVDVADLIRNSVYTYKGEYINKNNIIPYVDSTEITFNLYINIKFSFTTIEVYEYDKNNQLIHESVLYTYDDVILF